MRCSTALIQHADVCLLKDGTCFNDLHFALSLPGCACVHTVYLFAWVLLVCACSLVVNGVTWYLEDCTFLQLKGISHLEIKMRPLFTNLLK